MNLEGWLAILAVASLLFLAAVGMMNLIAEWQLRREVRRRNQAHPWRKGD